MAIRNVPKSFTFEQQRQEINNIASDIGDFNNLLFPANNVVDAINTLANNLNPNSGLFLSGVINPDSTIGLDGDFYLNTVTEELFGPKENGQWPTDPINFKGLLYGNENPTSSVGVDGAFYINLVSKDLFGPKTDGNWPLAAISLSDQFLYGAGAPDESFGKINNFYIDFNTRDLYGPKTELGWGNPISLSSQILSGNLPPLSLTGKIGDFYLDLFNKDLYGPKTELGWSEPIPLGEEEIGTVIFVKPDGDDSKSGLSIRNSVKTLKQACKIAQNTNGNITIRMFSGDYFEDNPIYVPNGTSIVGDNLRETVIRPINDGEDMLWVTSGSYINYLVIRDNYGNILDSTDSARGVGFLNTGIEREISPFETSLEVFAGNTLKRVDGIYKDASNILTYKKIDIVEYAYNEMFLSHPTLVIPGNDPEQTCKRDIGFYVDALIHDLKFGGNLKTVKFAQAYFDSVGYVKFIENELQETITAIEKATELAIALIENYSITQEINYLNTYPPVISGNCSDAISFVNTLSSIAIAMLNGDDGPIINPGPGYILVNQEWMTVSDFSNNVITIEQRGVNNPITGEQTIADRHISGSVITQGARVWRYGIAFPDQNGNNCRGRISLNQGINTVIGSNTNFQTQCFVGGFILVAGTKYKITSIQSDTELTIDNSPTTALISVKYKFIPPKERIFLSPYTQNCSAISVLGNSFYDTNVKSYDDTKTRGGGMLVDGSQLESNTPIKSMVIDAYTQVVSGGIGFHIKEDGYAQLVSIFQVFEDVGVLAESGGYASITNSATNFGREGLKAVGFSPNPYPFFIGNISNIQNITKTAFNANPSNILSSAFFQEEVTKIRFRLIVPATDISKFEVGQIVQIDEHTLPGSIDVPAISTLASFINSNQIEVDKIVLSDNIVEFVLVGITWNNAYSGLQGGQTGIATITAGSTYTAITAIGFNATPLPNYIIKAEGLPLHPSGVEFVVDQVLEYVENNYTVFTTQLRVSDEVVASIQNNTAINLRAPSTVNSSSHTFEYVGSGINYTALPQNGGRAIAENNFVEKESGKTYVSATDQDGNFFVGPFFKVDLKTGKATFSGAVALGVLDELQLRASPGVPIYEFSTDNDLGGGTGAKDTALPTQKAVRDYINKLSVLGNLIGLNKGTISAPGLLVQLDATGKINPDQLPPANPVNVYTVANEEERLNLQITNPGILQGDLAYQTDTEVTYILTALPTTIPDNWQVFSGTNINANNIVSGIISPSRLGSGVANESTFLNGLNKFVPTTQGLRPSLNSPLLISGNTNNVRKTESSTFIQSVVFNALLQRAEITTTQNHNLVTNDWVEVELVFPSGYNGFFQVTKIDDTTVSYPLSFNPGDYVDGGFITKGNVFDSGFTDLDIQRASFFNGQTSGSSTVGVVRYDYKTFDINPSSELLLREKGVGLSKIENIKRRSILGNNEFSTPSDALGNVLELGLGEDIEQVTIFNVVLSSGKYRITDRIINSNLGDLPSLCLIPGKSYRFNINAPGDPFFITTRPKNIIIPPNSTPSFNYTDGVKVINREAGAVFFTVPFDAPKVLYYQSGTNAENYGIITINSYDNTNVKFISSSSDTIIDTFPVTETSTCKYLIEIDNLLNNDIHSTEILLVQNTSKVLMTEYASLYNDMPLGYFSAQLNNNVVELVFTANENLPEINLIIKLIKITMF
jgi:hypothetical protein